MFLVKLALKNLTRHKRRTLITSSVIALGLFMYVFVDSMMVGLEEMSFKAIMDLSSGHIQVTEEAYWPEREQMPLDNLMQVDEESKTLLQNEHVSGYAPRLKFPANLNNGVDELPIMAVGIDPERDTEVLKVHEYFTEGGGFALGEYKAVLGKSLAELMELSIGDYLTLVLRTKDGAFNTLDAEIVGLVNTTDMAINDGTVFIPLDVAQEALNLQGYVSEVVVRLDNVKAVDTVVADLNQTFEDKGVTLTAESWKESAKELIAMGEAQDIENSVIISIILIIAGVGIINTVILSALERLEETGMMKAMGMREWEIIFVYMMEAAGIGLLGGVIGILSGIGGVILLQTVGIDLAWFGMGDMDWGIPIANKFYGGWNIGAFIFSFSFGIIVALLASILPARWAARKDPVEAIYHRGR